jgi:hypothetical protein
MGATSWSPSTCGVPRPADQHDQAIFGLRPVVEAGNVIAGGRHPVPGADLRLGGAGVVVPGEQFVKAGRGRAARWCCQALGTGLALASGDPPLAGPPPP